MWQELREELHPNGFEVVTVALDVGGVDATKEFVDRANANHPSLLDEAHVVDELFGVVAERLGMPLVHDEAQGLWALGPETAVTGRALTSAVAPELTLPDVEGRPFTLSSLRGQKVLLLAWASW